MKQEEKQLLYKDLCARMPYGVMCKVTSLDNPWIGDCELRSYWLDLVTDIFYEIKPYLRPMSSMTEEEVKEFAALESIDVLGGDKKITSVELSIDAIDWLNKHHFDYRGLIPMGLALEAPEGMYKTE